VGSLHSYDGSYTLDISGDGIALSGTALVGPAFHVIGAPLDDEVRPANTPLTVTWMPSGAQAATIETSHIPETSIPDTGSYTVPATALPGEVGMQEQDRVRVRRRSTVPVTGASTDSAIVFDVRNDVDFFVSAR
jgi:hypothetical protein